VPVLLLWVRGQLAPFELYEQRSAMRYEKQVIRPARFTARAPASAVCWEPKLIQRAADYGVFLSCLFLPHSRNFLSAPSQKASLVVYDRVTQQQAHLIIECATNLMTQRSP
jgi:hypothetical protein